MQTLARRIADLEKVMPKNKSIGAIFLVPLGDAANDVNFIYDNIGNQWSRHLDETVVAFRERVISSSTPEKMQVPLFFCTSQ